MKSRLTKAKRKAMSIIEAEIKTALHNGSNRLPSLEALSTRYGICKDTFRRVLVPYKQSGILKPTPGRGIVLCARSPDPAFPSAAEKPSMTDESGNKASPLRSKSIGDLIERDILLGNIDFSTAPINTKELVARYNGTYYLMRKAIDDLVSRNILQPARRGYQQRPRQVQSGNSTLVLVVRQFPAGLFPVPVTSLTTDFYHSAEHVSRQYRLRLHLCALDYQKDGRLQYSEGEKSKLAELDKSCPVAGFILWTRGFDRHDCRRLAEWLLSYQKPLAILSEYFTDGAGDSPPWNHPRIGRFPVGNVKEAGESVGCYLLGLGHKKVIYVNGIDPLANDDPANWERRRLAGIRSVYRDAGIEDSPKIISLPIPYTPEIYSLTAPSLHGHIENPVRDILSWFESRGGVPWRLYQKYKEIISFLLGWDSLGSNIADVFRRHLEACPASAVIGANDFIATGCLRSLRAMGMDVPGEISVIGFDDIPVAIQEQLTTYNFNVPAIMRAMVDFILASPQHIRGMRRGRTFMIPGYVVERLTVSTPRGDREC